MQPRKTIKKALRKTQSNKLNKSRLLKLMKVNYCNRLTNLNKELLFLTSGT